MAAVKLLSMQLMGKEQTHDRGAECDDRRFDNQDALRLLISSVQDVTMQSVANNCQRIKHPIGCTLQGKASTDIARQGQVGTVDMKLLCLAVGNSLVDFQPIKPKTADFLVASCKNDLCIVDFQALTRVEVILSVWTTLLQHIKRKTSMPILILSLLGTGLKVFTVNIN